MVDVVAVSTALTLFVVPALYGLVTQQAGMPGRQTQRLARQKAGRHPAETHIG